jgi:hypothetical protein
MDHISMRCAVLIDVEDFFWGRRIDHIGIYLDFEEMIV